MNKACHVKSDGTTPYVKPYDTYSVGDTFTLGTDSYHVIADSGINQDYVVALKDTPLTVAEVTAAGGTANDNLGDGSIGGMSYGSNSTYATSTVKSVVDSWAAAKFTDELKTVDGYSARLIQINEVTNLGYEWSDNGRFALWQKTASTPDWVYNSNYWYWTMSPYNNTSSNVWYVNSDGSVGSNYVYSSGGAVRPVINVYKSAIQS